MLHIFTIICLLFSSLFISPEQAMSGMSIAGVTVSGGIAGGERVTSVVDGFVGWNLANNSPIAIGTSTTIGTFQSDSPTTIGTVSYAHTVLYSVEAGDIIVALYDSSNNRVAYGKTTVEGWGDVATKVDIPLVTPYLLTAQTYNLVMKRSGLYMGGYNSGKYLAKFSNTAITDPPQETFGGWTESITNSTPIFYFDNSAS